MSDDTTASTPSAASVGLLRARRKRPDAENFGGEVSLDDLVGADEHCGWQIEAERLRSFEIDDELQFGRKLHWEVGQVGAAEIDALGSLGSLREGTETDRYRVGDAVAATHYCGARSRRRFSRAPAR